jgi:hypothetical protein
MAVTRYVSNIYKGFGADTKPTTNVREGAVFHELDTQKHYFYYAGAWREGTGYNAGLVGYSGTSGYSGFTNVVREYIVTASDRQTRTPITLPGGMYVTGNANHLLVFTEGVIQQRDTVSGANDFDYLICRSGNSTTAAQIWFNYAVPEGVLLTFKQLFIFILLAVIL